MKVTALFILTIILPSLLLANPDKKEHPSVHSKLCQMALTKIQKSPPLFPFLEAIEQEKIQDFLTLIHRTPENIEKSNLLKTLLYYASMKGKARIISTLVSELNIDVNIKDLDGWTPLHYAMLSSSLSSRLIAIDTLIDLGANINELDYFGYKPSQYTRKGRHSGYTLYSQDQQRQAVELVFKITTPQIASTLQLDESSLLEWATLEVSDVLQLSHETLTKWVNDYEKDTSVPRQTLLIDSQATLSTKTEQKPIDTEHQSTLKSLSNIATLFDIPKALSYSQADIKNAIKLVDRIGLWRTSEQLEISKELLSFWIYLHRVEANYQLRQLTNYYSMEKKSQVVQFALRVTIAEASKRFNISLPSVQNWLNQYNKIAQSFY